MNDPDEVRTRRTAALALGLAMAGLVPVLAIVIAVLWDNGIVALDPDGPLVKLIRQAQVWTLIIGPIGLIVIGWALRIRGILAWASLVIVGLPLLAYSWFVGAAWIGGLSGEPF